MAVAEVKSEVKVEDEAKPDAKPDATTDAKPPEPTPVKKDPEKTADEQAKAPPTPQILLAARKGKDYKLRTMSISMDGYVAW